jgi:asparagine synthase (glutamine-hydrolysing)
MNEELLAEVLPPELIGSGARAPEASMTECYERAAGLPMLDQVLYANFKTYLPDDLAVKMDRMSMAHSLETRSPFLDTALVEYVASIPAREKVGLRRLKPALRRALWPMLPPEIWNRRKHGFGVPMGQWLRAGDLRTIVEDELLSESSRCRDYLDCDILARMWREHQQGEVEHGFRFWTLLTLERWLRGLERPVELKPPTLAIAA